MRRRAAAVLIALLLGWLLGRWVPYPAAAPRPEAGPGAHAQEQAEPAWKVEAMSSADLPVGARQGLGFDGAARLRDLPAWLDDLAQRGAAGEGAALEQLAHWTDYCERARGAAAMQRYGGRQALDLADPEVHAWFAGLVPVCAAWIARQPWLQTLQAECRPAVANESGPCSARTLSQALLARARDAGDWVARLRSGAALPSPDCASAACRREQQRAVLLAAWSTRDPRVYAEIGELGNL